MTDETSGEVILYQRDDGAPALEVRLDAETATCRKSRQVRAEGSRQVTREIPFYNLDLIISVGYRVKSKVATQFCIWATELKKLNTLVSACFDATEFRVRNHEPTYMKDWLAPLDRLIVAMGAQTLPGAGSVSQCQAVTHAEGEYAKYRGQIDAMPDAAEEAYLKALKRVQRGIEGKQ